MSENSISQAVLQQPVYAEGVDLSNLKICPQCGLLGVKFIDFGKNKTSCLKLCKTCRNAKIRAQYNKKD